MLVLGDGGSTKGKALLFPTPSVVSFSTRVIPVPVQKEAAVAVLLLVAAVIKVL